MVTLTSHSPGRAVLPLRRVFAALLASFGAAAILATPASAALREYRVEFAPSVSASAAGYTLHVGMVSGDYDMTFNLGAPPSSGGTVVYAVDLEESIDLFVALSAYDSIGLRSALSNEMRIAATPPPPPGDGGGSDPGDGGDGGGDGNGGDDSNDGGGGDSPGDTGDGGSGAGDMPMNPIDLGFGLGLTTSRAGMISALLEDGSLEFLTMDSLAVRGRLRPVRCDLDGDGDHDLVIGFGPRSRGQVALIFVEDGAVASVASIEAGPELYRRRSGRTRPACGDLDGDGRAELVIGFGPRMRGVVQAFDDVTTGFAPMVSTHSDADGYMQIPVPDKFRGPTYPAIGDIDGDGRGELIIGMGRTKGGGLLAVLDDFQADFAIHPGNPTGTPWLRVDPNPSRPRPRLRTRTMPALGDLDGDGRDEIAVSFGRGSRGIVAILQDAIDGLPAEPSEALLISTGRQRYQRNDGETRVAIGDVDDDGVEELIVGFRRSGDHEVQVLDDFAAGSMTPMAAMTADSGFVGTGTRSIKIYPVPLF